MRQIFVVLAVGAPLFLAALFIANGIASDSFPALRDAPPDGPQSLRQAYLAGLDHCQGSYETPATLEGEREYSECVRSVEAWYAGLGG